MSANDIYIDHDSALLGKLAIFIPGTNDVYIYVVHMLLVEPRKFIQGTKDVYIHRCICAARNQGHIHMSKYYSFSVMLGCLNENTYLLGCILKSFRKYLPSISVLLTVIL